MVALCFSVLLIRAHEKWDGKYQGWVVLVLFSRWDTLLIAAWIVR